MLDDLSVRQGRWADSPESAKVCRHCLVSFFTIECAQSIPKFIESFKDQILMSDVALPVSKFATFNEFFYRYATAKYTMVVYHRRHATQEADAVCPACGTPRQPRGARVCSGLPHDCLCDGGQRQSVLDKGDYYST